MFLLQENERVTMYVRRHWIWLLAEALGVLLLFALPVAIVQFISLKFFMSTDLIFNYPVQLMADLFTYIWTIFSWVFFADRFTKYALNFWVLTNKRLVESEYPMLFSRKLSTLPLETIEDVTIKYEGLLENLLSFGSLSVQTAGTQREFFADDIADPEGVKQAIFAAREGLKEEDREVTVMNVSDVSDAEEINELHSKLDKVYAETSPELNIESSENNKHFQVPQAQRTNTYDWANISAQQASDTRNITEQIDINTELKKNVDDALRY